MTIIALALVTSIVLQITAQSDDTKCYIQYCTPPSCMTNPLSNCNDNFKMLYFNPQVYELRKNLVISNRKSFAIIGNGVTFVCKDSASLLVFSHIDVFQMTNVTLVNCGATFAGHDITEPSGILLHNVTAAQFSSIVFKNINGYAIYAVDFQKLMLFNIAYENSHNNAMCLFVSTATNLNITYSDYSSSFPALFKVVQHQKWLSVTTINGSNSFIVSNKRPLVFILYLFNRQITLTFTFINNNFIINMTTKCLTPCKLYISSDTLLLQYCEFYGNNNLKCVNVTTQGKHVSSLVINSERVQHDLKFTNLENGGSVLKYNIDDDAGNDSNSICYCGHTQTICSTNITISPSIYPGQNITIPLKSLSEYKTVAYVTSTESNPPQCEVVYSSFSHQINFIYKRCTNIIYTVRSNSTEWCALTLKTIDKGVETAYTFIIRLRRCPLGLSLINGLCVCDHHLEEIGITCNIMDGTFNTPSYSWISATTVNFESRKSDLMYTSNCYMDYCSRLPTIGVDLYESNSQCLHDRDGVLCGKCKKGYSAVFGTSNCKKCTNVWYLLVLACAVAGVLLVVLLFMLNLTIVDGDIYGFLLYANVLSIYSSRIFPPQHRLMYVPVMLANLDLGFEVCFYTGMTSYATIWLQFLFPIYMIMIVIGLSFASRYFRFIQRLTCKRVIPVIATLYLLACNKMMLTIAKVFSYRQVHYLYSGVIELYWAVDTSIPFLGAEFIVQLVFCLMIFLFILIPTVVLFLISKRLLRYKFVAKFLKPFLDAYQAPLKDNCYYFLGIELLVRIAVVGLDSVPANFTAAIYTTILLIYFVFLNIFQPFKSSLNGALYSVYCCILGCIALLFLSYAPEMPVMYAVIFGILVYLGMLIFLGIVIIHFFKYILHKDLSKYCFRKYKLLSMKLVIDPLDNSETVAGSCENFREDLFAIDPEL